MNAFLSGLVVAEGIAIVILLVALSLVRQVAAERAKRLREALIELAHAKNVLLLKEASVADLESILIDAGVLRRDGVFDSKRGGTA